MEVLNKTLERQIMDNKYYNKLFVNIDKNQIELIKNQIKVSPFLDFILDFNDYHNLDSLINNVPNDNSNRLLIIDRIIEDYLYFKIIEDFSTSEYDSNEIRNILFGGNFNEYKSMDTLLWMFIEREIEQASLQTEGQCARFHFFMDSVDDIKLQHKINDLYRRQSKIKMMGYTAHDKLISYLSDIGVFIQDTHDYQTYDLKK